MQLTHSDTITLGNTYALDAASSRCRYAVQPLAQR